MSTVFEASKIAGKRSSKSLKNVKSILKTHFNLNEFYYHKISHSGQLILFQGNLDLIECFEAQQLVSKYPLYCHPKYRQAGIQISKELEDPSLRELKDLREYSAQLGLRLWCRLTNKTAYGVEEFGFYSPQEDERERCFLLNHMQELRLFCRWFLETHKHTISFLEESPVNLVAILGARFYENRLHVPFRQTFLESLGVKTESPLSDDEKDTLRLLIGGYTASQMAKQLYRSTRAIEHRIENIKRKLVCSNRSELIQKAHELEKISYEF